MTRTMRASGLALALAFAASLAPVPAGAQAQPAGMEQLLISAPPPAPVAQQPAGVPQSVGAPQASPSFGPKGNGQTQRDDNFQKALKAIAPVSPDQVRTYRQADDKLKREMVVPVNPGRPVSRAVRVTLKPGEEPPVVRVQPGIVSTLTFSDVTGQPWPVLSVVTGNPSVYVAQAAGEEGKTNIIVLSAIAQHIPSNLAVTLVGHPVPILLSLEQDRPETDYRIDVRMDAKGPNAAQEIVGVSSLAPTNDSLLIKFLDGTPPAGARPLKTSSPDVEAWKFEDIQYVRTRGEILSPAYTARSNSVAGVNVYLMADSPVLLVSTGGQTTRVKVWR